MAKPTMKDDIVVNKPSAVLQQYLPSTKPVSKDTSSATKEDKGPTRKQMLLQQNIDRRRQYESMVSEWQDKLLDPVSEQVLGEAANRLKQSHYVEIIEERNIEKLCGYPLCSRPPRDIKGKFRISLNERRVYDITPLKQFCSSKCLVASRWFESQLTEEPLYLINKNPEQLAHISVSIVPLDMDLEEFQRTRGRHMPAGAPETEPSKPIDAFTIESPDLLDKVVPTHASNIGLSNNGSGASQQPSSEHPLQPSHPTSEHPLQPSHPTSEHSPQPSHPTSEHSPQPSHPTSPPLPSLSPNANAYIQSILATVPSTPSTIRIIERESSMQPSVVSKSTATVQQNDIDQAMQDAYGPTPSQQRHTPGSSETFEVVEGFRVPVSRSTQQKPSTLLLSHRKKHAATPSVKNQDASRQGQTNPGEIERGLANITITDQQQQAHAPR